MAESWKEIPGLSGYAASTDGYISRNGITLNPGLPSKRRNSDYLRVKLDLANGYGRILVHRLIAYTFLGPQAPWLEVNHKNGNKLDNRLENLEYVTKSQNHKHSYNVLRQHRNTGPLHGMAKLTDDQARQIRAAYDAGMTGRIIANQFNVSTATVSFIGLRRTWKHLADPE